ncbi:MAG: hypothetical protein AB8G05_23975 [Oligoflexales bacterium]
MIDNIYQETEKQYKSVLRALEEIELNGSGFLIESNGAKRSVTRKDYDGLVMRERRLLARLNKLSGNSTSRWSPVDS